MPIAPGTVASVVALPLAWLIAAGAGDDMAVDRWRSSSAHSASGPANLYARETGSDDPSECVIDEVAGQWIACAFAPLSLWGFALAFVLFRLFDIIEAWPVSAAERLPGGLGIMADDIVAGADGRLRSLRCSPLQARCDAHVLLALLSLAEVVLAERAQQKLRIATAESCTGGLIAALLTEIPGSSDVFDRGFIVYSNRAKAGLLGVPGDLIAESGAVSEAVARAMAEGAVENSQCAIAVAVTGVAGPGGGTPLKPVGLVHIAAAREGRSILHEAHRFGDIGRTESPA